MTKKVLITGMSGLIGGLVRQHLQGKYELTGLNRSAVPGEKCIQADLFDLEAIRPAFEGQDVVVHLAAKSGNDFTWQEYLETNIIGTYNVFLAALKAGVQRVIFASSGATTSGWEKDEPLKAIVEGRYEKVPEIWPQFDRQTPSRPNGVYGATKIWGEALGRHFADMRDLSVISLRIGMVNAANKPLNSRGFSVWCSHRDIVEMIEACITAPKTIKYDVFYVISKNKWGYRDMSRAKEILGFEAQDAAEYFR